MIIDIIDLGIGNISSLQNSLHRLNILSRRVDSTQALNSDTILLPGVGAMGVYMNRLESKGFDSYIVEAVKSNVRVIGICLGFQVLTKYSEESGGVKCLGLIEGITHKLSKVTKKNISTHNGWEEFFFDRSLLQTCGYKNNYKRTRKNYIRGRVFYNHEYGVIPEMESNQSIQIPNEKINSFSSLYVNKNIIGMQFHPEKSQHTGLQLLSMIL